jgi:Family of unknown function (DUF6012)
MLLHIRPRLFCPFGNVELVELTIDPLGLHLRGGVDLATRRPYPNKRYAVACRREGRKAIDGILIESSRSVAKLDYTARWVVDAEFVATHRVGYKLLDHEFDAASDNMTLWYATSRSLGGWSSRWPAWAEGLPPATAEPRMEIIPGDASRAGDVLDARGRIVERREVFSMPTIERERILNPKLDGERTPTLDSAFRLGSIAAPRSAHRPVTRKGVHKVGPHS